jgi:hypothetical protein
MFFDLQFLHCSHISCNAGATFLTGLAPQYLQGFLTFLPPALCIVLHLIQATEFVLQIRDLAHRKAP